MIAAIVTLGIMTAVCSTPFSLSQNTKYLRSQKFQIDIANLPTMTTWNPITYNACLITPFQDISKALFLLALDTIHIEFEQKQLECTSDINLINATSLQFLFFSSMPHRVSQLAIRYLILPDSNPNIAVINLTLIGPIYIGNLNYGIAYLPSQEPFLNGTKGIKHVTFLRGMDVSAYNESLVLDLNISIGGNQTLISCLITSASSTPTYLKTLHIFIIIYNQQHYNQPSYASFFSANFSGSASPLIYTNNSNVYEPATMVGLNGFSIKGDPFLHFSISFQDSNQFSLSSQNQQHWFKIEYILFHTYYCNHLTPYYSEEEDQCFAECPVRSVGMKAGLTCQACPYDCYTCNEELQCLSCNSSQDFRILNSSRCIPLAGYFQNWTSKCQLCPQGCSQCLSLIECISCTSNYQMSNSTCIMKDSKYDQHNNPLQTTIKSDPSILDIALGVVGGLIALTLIIIGVVKIRNKYFNGRGEIYQPERPQENEVGLSMINIMPIQEDEWRRATITTFSHPICDICLQELTDQASVKIRCNHIYHAACIVKWSQRNPSCPYCRTSIQDDDQCQLFCRCGKCFYFKTITFQNICQIQNEGNPNRQFLRLSCR